MRARVEGVKLSRSQMGWLEKSGSVVGGQEWMKCRSVDGWSSEEKVRWGWQGRGAGVWREGWSEGRGTVKRRGGRGSWKI